MESKHGKTRKQLLKRKNREMDITWRKPNKQTLKFMLQTLSVTLAIYLISENILKQLKITELMYATIQITALLMYIWPLKTISKKEK